METHRLFAHPDRPPAAIRDVVVEWRGDASEALLIFRIIGDTELLLPAAAEPIRTDELWRTTCAELFVRPDGGDGYVEFNFSPSGAWAVYAFDGYRVGMRAHPSAVAPRTAIRRQYGIIEVEIDVDFSDLTGKSARVGLAAILEENTGHKSYWALRHPPGPPDFHHPDCFTIELPPPDSP